MTSRAKSLLASATNHVAASDKLPQRWGQWASGWGQRIAQSESQPSPSSPSSASTPPECLHILPGWIVVVPRPRTSLTDDMEITPFDLRLVTSGYAHTMTSRENASRSQRVLMRMARTFADLPADIDPYHTTTLDTRLQPFWSSALQRQVHLSIYPVRLPRRQTKEADQVEEEEDEPLIQDVVSTDARGLFSTTITIPWERIISHGPSVAMAFQRQHQPQQQQTPHQPPHPPPAKWGLYLEANLMSEGSPSHLPPEPESTSLARSVGATTYFSPPATPTPIGPSGLTSLGSTKITSHTITPFSLHSLSDSEQPTVRLVSDLDDTIKISNILSGARQVFTNAFVKPIQETGVDGMADLYTTLANQAGIDGFHYVSNSPYELWPVLKEFFSHHQFPPGFSIDVRLPISVFLLPDD